MATEKTPIKPKEVRAYARYIHVSPQKLRLVSMLVKKTPVDTALEQLKFSSRSASFPLIKAINSAIANAIHNYEMKQENLFIKSITIDPGPMFKRYQPRAQGRAFMVRKRTSHINVVLEEKERKNKSERTVFQSRRPTEVNKADEKAQSTDNEAEVQKPKLSSRPENKIRRKFTDFRQKFFNRKSSTS
jgi:large subunit ribosomal protein L22